MAIQSIEMTSKAWDGVLALRQGRIDETKPCGAVFELYGTLAQKTGPFVLAQVGQSLDGRVATPTGDARDISGPDGLAHLHRCRALVDAVIVGENTVTTDNPRLSVRIVKGGDPVRVVIDCHARLSGEEGIFHDGGTPVILFQSVAARPRHLPNTEVISLVPEAGTGLRPEEILKELAARGYARILVEGGAKTIARFVDAGLVDHLHVAVSPIIIGSGPTGISLPPIEKLSAAHRPDTKVFNLGSDILFDCRFSPQSLSDRQSDEISVPHGAKASRLFNGIKTV
ncbi:riboflavin-specific deaminase C-terminal domain-containing protein [Cohaesibacter marisflavi]|uniref:Riboflavin-specific deaminase C-terminal domain-containing protein n=1 Tax=Cohaesibacter marisflavi TaxID=655353 RepID=A0A1I5KKF2_9HYPH|nr:RibD family protein [Cohaesibacter marisflavi]SFO85283.1 riboflavin-specific deaminase C-terminal domain-containing protein [Cohaesibacter marisflavi]